MFKQLTIAILFFAFVSQTFRGPFVLVDYYTNTAAFAKNCINKARPKMHCNGKCQMMKQLQEQENKEQQDAANKLDIKIALLTSRQIYCAIALPLTILKKASCYETNKPATDVSLDIFHPPQA